ncbi:HIT family protein [Herbaspirillum rhizosphaerae]|uniref:HIT family protein n=1 Tax=Herbaspirillum rhizosphaerae TaxID=346179 RepID=UPI000AC263AA|nr:hypothetical protein [Herbaspirillum rhizosphaerae]
MINKCNLCSELSGQIPDDWDGIYKGLVSAGKNKIVESDNFVVVPSAGPLNDSHVMLVPKLHVNSFAILPPSLVDEAMHIIEKLQRYTELISNQRLIFFESGSGTGTSHAGGCIVHAHIHCLIESDEFRRRIFEEITFTLIKGEHYPDADLVHGYVWYRDTDSQSYMCNDPLLPSQFLRYLYSQCAGDIRMWNWRRHINFDGMYNVLDRYKDLSFS